MRNDTYYGMPVNDEDNRPVRINLDPAKNVGNYCYNPAEDCALVIERKTRHYDWKTRKSTEKRTLRVLTGSGDSGEKLRTQIGWVTDTGLGHRHDHVGLYTIVGIIETDGSRRGHIPSHALRHYVMK